MEIPDRPSRDERMLRQAAPKLHQFGTLLARRERLNRVSGAVALAITLKSRSSTQC